MKLNRRQQPKCKNPNHPKKGSSTFIEPIRDLKDIASIKKLLSNEPRNLLLFVMGINNGLRAGDLLKLKVGEVRNLKPDGYVRIKEEKTKKFNSLYLNKTVYKCLHNYLDETDLNDDDWLFANLRARDKHISVNYLNNLLKKWTGAIHLKGNFGSHTLRKSFACIQRLHFKVSWELITARLGHSSPGITRAYLGISDDEINGILRNEI